MGFEVSAAQAIDLCVRGLGLATVQQAAETLSMSGALTELGLWRRGEGAAFLASRRVQLGTQALRLVCGLALVFFGSSWAVVLAFLLSLLGNWPVRGTLNGGSDSMTFVLGLGLSVAYLGGAEPLTVSFGLYFVGVQSVLSYLIAGVTKWKESEWRDGSSLQSIAQSSRYAVPREMTPILRRPSVCRGAAISILLFECAFPLVLVNPTSAFVFCCLGMAFHLAIAFVLGLHRFWPVWMATYPALLWWSAAP